MSVAPTSAIAVSSSSVVSQGLAETQNTNGVTGISDAVQSFSKVLSEQTAAAQEGTIHDRAPLQADKHSSNKSGRQLATSGKAKDSKRSAQELPLVVPVVPSVEVPPKGTVPVEVPANKGKGEIRLAQLAGDPLPDAVPAHSQVIADPTTVQPLGRDVSSGAAGIEKVAGFTADQKSHEVVSGKINLDALKTPVTIPGSDALKTPVTTPGSDALKTPVTTPGSDALKTPVTTPGSDALKTPVTTPGSDALKTPVTTSGSETPKVSSSQEGSIIPGRAAAPTVAVAAKSAGVSVPAVPLSQDSSSTQNGLKISADLSPVKGSPSAQAGVKVRSASGGLVDTKPSPAGPARTASSDRVLSTADASSGIGAAASLNSAQMQKVMNSSTISFGSISGNGSPVLDVKALSQAISHPLIDGHGTQTVLVAMDPTYLGHLEAVVSIDHAGLQVTITPQTQVGHNALANSIEALKNHLSQGGLNVNVTLHDSGSHPGNEHGNLAGQPHRGPTVLADTAGIPASESVSASIAGQIHLIL